VLLGLAGGHAVQVYELLEREKVPVEKLEQMRRFARRQALDFLERQKQSTVSEEQALEVALEAQRSARKRTRKPRRRTK